MKIHSHEIFKRNIQFIIFLLTASISIIAIVISLRIISRASKPMIIAIDNNGTRIVTESNDPIYKTEALSFLQKFLFNVYNFNAENFMKRIGLATSVMSEELWKKKRSEILDLKSKIERDEISIASQIMKITLDDAGIYHALISVKEKSRLNEQEHNVEVSIKLKPVERNRENSYGLEVDSYEETLARQ